MSNMMDLELLKEIPGYKAILKSVIKTQIQLLIEQLCDHTGEESIILTASINDGTLSHLGSNMGKGFFEGRDEIKSQFLGYCLKNHHNRDVPEPRTAYQRDEPPDRFNQGHSGPKRQKLYSDNTALTLDFENQDMQNYNIPVAQAVSNPNPKPVKGKPLSRKLPARPPAKSPKSSSSTLTHDSSIQNIVPGSDTNTTRTIVKVEKTSDDQDSSYTPVPDTGGESSNISDSVSLPTSVHLSYTQSQSSTTANGDFSKTDSSEQSGIKVEPITEEDLELEITGVEMAGGDTAMPENWEQNISGEMGYQPDVSGDDSLDQSGSQFNLVSGVSPRPCGSRTSDLEPSRPQDYPETQIRDAQSVWSCDTCERQFSTKWNLERHVKVHSGVKDCICPVCNKSLSRKEYLKVHMQSHANQRDFICPDCSKRFNRKDVLKGHLWNVHGVLLTSLQNP